MTIARSPDHTEDEPTDTAVVQTRRVGDGETPVRPQGPTQHESMPAKPDPIRPQGPTQHESMPVEADSPVEAAPSRR